MKRYLSVPSITVLSVLLLTILVASVYYTNYLQTNKQETYAGGGAVPSPLVKRMLSMTKDDRTKEIARTHDEVPSIDKAQKKVDFKVLVPNDTAGGKLERIFVERVENQKVRCVRLVYSNGIFVTETPLDAAPEYSDFLAEQSKNVQLGVQKEAVFRSIKVNGHKGMGAEPGVNELPGETYPRPSSVDWFDNGVKIVIIGGETNLQDLLKVAESMY